LVEQLIVWLVHASLNDPQKFAGQAVFGVQHLFASVPPAAPHWVPGSLAQVVSHVRTVPLHGSVHVAPQ
jgi:hypothetical protein